MERGMKGATDYCSHGTSSSPTYTWNHDFLGFFSDKVTWIYTPCTEGVGGTSTWGPRVDENMRDSACPRSFDPLSIPFQNTSTFSLASCPI
jgi:hypothetical protein